MDRIWEMGMPWQGILVVVLLGAPAAFAFPVALAFVKWNKSSVGKASMFAGLALALIFAQGLASIWFNRADWFPWVVLFVDTFLMLAVWFHLATFIKVIREGRKPTIQPVEEM